MKTKKFVAVLLLLAITIFSVTGALASTDFSWSGSDTTTFWRWGPSQTSSGTQWHITWDITSNMSPSLRAAVRIYANPGVYASSTWVYSSQSSAYHPYNDGYGNGDADTYIAGRLDNRDSGTLKVKGVFHN